MIVTNGGGRTPLWSGDGKELFYIAPDGTATALAVKAGPTFQAGDPKALVQGTVRTPVLGRGAEHFRGRDAFSDAGAGDVGSGNAENTPQRCDRPEGRDFATKDILPLGRLRRTDRVAVHSDRGDQTGPTIYTSPRPSNENDLFHCDSLGAAGRRE